MYPKQKMRFWIIACLFLHAAFAVPDGEPSLYQTLGVESSVSTSDLRKAYRKQALRYHPDKAGAGSVEQFIRISEAYHILSDPVKRTRYDADAGKQFRQTSGNRGHFAFSFSLRQAVAVLERFLRGNTVVSAAL